MAPKRKWTKQEEEILKQMTAEKQPNEIIAEKIDRTVVALEQRQKKLGIIEPPKRRRWTEEEDFDLRFYYAEGETSEQLAERLRRTPDAIKQRLYNLKLMPNGVIQGLWTPEDDALVGILFKEGKTNAEIAAQLGRTVGAISKRRSLLGIKKTWTPEEDKLLLKLRKSGESFESISYYLGRPKTSVNRRYCRLSNWEDRETIEDEPKSEIELPKTFRPEPYTGPSVTEVSLEAKRLGMSYGQYVAMQHQERSETW